MPGEVSSSWTSPAKGGIIGKKVNGKLAGKLQNESSSRKCFLGIFCSRRVFFLDDHPVRQKSMISLSKTGVCRSKKTY